MIVACPALAPFVFVNKYSTKTIDFADPTAVKLLNRALLQRHYGITCWDIPPGYLCPPIPGRADYIHYLADLLAEDGNINLEDKKPSQPIRILDIGTGANCIYPIIGNHSYGWQFVGSEVDAFAFANAKKIVERNQGLRGQIELRRQPNSKDILTNIIQPDEHFAATICNPPFHASAKAALAATQRKVQNLQGKKTAKIDRNFGGKANELWCPGGELQFIRNMIGESRAFAKSVGWFTTLVSKESNIAPILRAVGAAKFKHKKVIEMGQGNKRSRMVAWR